MEASTAPEGRYYRPELDVVRFLAFLLVFLYHVVPNDPDARITVVLKDFAPVLYATSNAFGFGLSLFFTLSAFLICELLLRERETAGKLEVKQFYIRRILRIWPLYYLGLFLGALVALLPGGHPADLIKVGWFSLFLAAWYVVTHGYFSQPMLPLWSISVEEQFYLFAPWVVKYFSRKALYGFCTVLILVANLWLYHLGRVLATDNRIWANSLVQFECFGAGILLCLILHGRLPKIAAWHRVMVLASAWICWFTATYFLNARFGTGVNPGSWPLIGGYALASLGSVLVLVAFLGVSPRILPSWAIYLGRISFGLYVFHEFAIYVTSKLMVGHLNSFMSPVSVLKLVLTLALNVLMAALSYRYFETPFLRIKKRHAVIESQPVGKTVPHHIITK